MNLIVNKGDIAAYKWGNDQVTTAVIDVPLPAYTDLARESEKNYMSVQLIEAGRRYEELQKYFRGEPNLKHVADKGEMVMDVGRLVGLIE
jgi:hypothetical protein